jgi:putative transposase
MTTETMDLRALLEKTTDTDFLRHMIGFTAQRLMALEVEGLTGAAPGARTPDRLHHRDGYRDRDWETRPGRHRRAPHPEAAQGPLLPGFP